MGNSLEEQTMRLLEEKRVPYTIEQLAAHLRAPYPMVRRAVLKLQRLGFVKVETVAPNVEMVIPRGRLGRTSPEERERLLKKLEEFFY